LALQRVNDVHCAHRLPSRVLRVNDGVANGVFQEDFEHAARFFKDQRGDAFDTASPGETANRRLRDALNVVAKHFAMPLCTLWRLLCLLRSKRLWAPNARHSSYGIQENIRLGSWRLTTQFGL
jgi:hypothetical protein